MNGLDGVLAVVVLFYFWRGWAKGLLRSFLGPLIWVVFVAVAYWYYQQTQNLWVSLAIGVIGPILGNIVFYFLLLVMKKVSGKTDKNESALALVNRFLGGVFSAAWIILFMGVSLVLFVMIPVKIPGLEGARSIAFQSTSFYLVKGVAGKYVTFPGEQDQPVDLAQDASFSERLQKNSEYGALMNDERLKAVFEDQETMEKIQNRDFLALMNDPKIQKIMSDPELVKKFFRLNQAMIELNKSSTEKKE